MAREVYSRRPFLEKRTCSVTPDVTGRSRSSKQGRRNPSTPEIKIGRKAGLFLMPSVPRVLGGLVYCLPWAYGTSGVGPHNGVERSGKALRRLAFGARAGRRMDPSLDDHGSELKRSVGSESGCCQSDFRGRPFRRGVRGLQQASLFGKTDLFCHTRTLSPSRNGGLFFCLKKKRLA